MSIGELIEYNIGIKVRKLADTDIKAKKEKSL